MVYLIVGKEGKGKTTHLLDKVNEEIKEATGNIVFLDRSSKHMFELNNKVRLINVSEFDFENSSEFVGFVYGIISQDNDMQQMYIDGMMKIAKLNNEDLLGIIKKFDKICEQFNLDMIISASVDKSELADELQDKVILAL